jgi:hypothetical protein
MTPPATSPDWLTLAWQFWTANSQSLYRLFLSVAGIFTAALLAWRAWATDRQARAALKQADVALRRHEEQTQADRERRITETFAKAVEQLGSEKLPTRLGAIYTLERLSRESEREYWPIMETLTAYVRENAPWPPRDAPFDDSKDPKPAADIQAILTVLGRRREEDRQNDKGRLDLRMTDLRGANLNNAHLERAFLYCAHLHEAMLADAHLMGATLAAADLHRANLCGADLTDAYVTQAQLDSAFGDENTILPEGRTRPAHWERGGEPETPPAA